MHNANTPIDFLIGADPGNKGAIFVEDMRGEYNNPGQVKLLHSPDESETIISGEYQYYLIDLAVFRTIEQETRGRGAKKKIKEVRGNWFEFEALSAFFSPFYGYNCLMGLEQVQEMPKNRGMFQFGAGFGRLMMSAEVNQMRLFTNLFLLRPAKWKKELKLIKVEDQRIIDLSLELLPALAPHLENKEKHPNLDGLASEIDLLGRAEAFLIAHYTWSNHSGYYWGKLDAERFAEAEKLASVIS